MQKIQIRFHVSQIYLGVILLALFCYILLLNHYTPYWSDDFVFSNIYGTHIKVSSLWDVIRSQGNEYVMWSGRVFLFGLNQILLMLGKNVFDGVNSIIFIIFPLLLVQFTRPRSWNKVSDIAISGIAIMLIWYCIPEFGQTILWKSAAANYLWPGCLMLIWLIPYRYLLDGKFLFKDSGIARIGMAGLGFVAGWSHENASSILVIIILGGFFISLILQLLLKKKISPLPVWVYTGAAAVLVGFVFLIAAPGNQARINQMYAGMSLAERLQNFIPSLKTVISQSRLLLTILVSVILVRIGFVLVFKDRQAFFSKMRFVIGFCAVSFLGLIPMAVSPEFPVRASFCASIFIIAAILFVFDDIFSFGRQSSLVRIALNIGFSFSLFLLILNMNQVYQNYRQLNQEIINRNSIIFSEKNKGNLDVVVPPLTMAASHYMYIYDLYPDPNANPNIQTKNYYGLNSIIVDIPHVTIEFDHTPPFDWYSVYYDSGQNYNENEVSRFYVGNLLESGNRLIFKLPDTHIQTIRFDPGNAADVPFKIRSISIKTIDYTMTLTGEDLLKKIRYTNDINQPRFEAPFLVFTTSGTDPFFDFSLP